MFHVHVFDLGIPRVRSSVASTSPGVGVEPTTERLTAARSTAELPRIKTVNLTFVDHANLRFEEWYVVLDDEFHHDVHALSC